MKKLKSYKKILKDLLLLYEKKLEYPRDYKDIARKHKISIGIISMVRDRNYKLIQEKLAKKGYKYEI